jgi:hypothetical protein
MIRDRAAALGFNSTPQSWTFPWLELVLELEPLLSLSRLTVMATDAGPSAQRRFKAALPDLKAYLAASTVTVSQPTSRDVRAYCEHIGRTFPKSGVPSAELRRLYNSAVEAGTWTPIDLPTELVVRASTARSGEATPSVRKAPTKKTVAKKAAPKVVPPPTLARTAPVGAVPPATATKKVAPKKAPAPAPAAIFSAPKGPAAKTAPVGAVPPPTPARKAPAKKAALAAKPARKGPGK